MRNRITSYNVCYTKLLRDIGHPELAPDLGKIRSAGRHLLALINDILDLVITSYSIHYTKLYDDGLRRPCEYFGLLGSSGSLFGELVQSGRSSPKVRNNFV